MTKAEYKELITPALVREIFEGNVVDSYNRKYAITVGGKIVSVAGKVFYDTHEQAVKGFYNSFGWRARRVIYRAANPTDDSWRWWRSADNRTMWTAFKEALKEKYGFDIIQL